MIEYEQHLQLPAKYVKTKILEFLSEDIPTEDVTTNCIINTKSLIEFIILTEPIEVPLNWPK